MRTRATVATSASHQHGTPYDERESFVAAGSFINPSADLLAGIG